MPITTRNPATEEVEKEFESLSEGAVAEKIDRAAEAFDTYRKTSFKDRREWLHSAAGILEDRKKEFGKILTAEMGKTITSAIAEVEKCAWVCRFYADEGEAFLSDRKIETDASRSFVRHLPIGPVLAIMPWNFPFWQVFRFAAPALMAGNVGLLKHASNVPQSALAIEEILREAGFPEDTFQTLLIGSGKVEAIISNPKVRAVTLTGSEQAGRAVASNAGDALKKCVLELGGSDAFVVMPSADLENAVEMAVKGGTINNGQSCIAAKRFIVHSDLYDAFRDRMAEKLDALTVGDPMKEETEIGPLALAQIRDELVGQVEESVQAGARRVTGAEAIDGKGFFFKPGMLEDIPESAPAYSEELFGPVACLFKVDDLDEAIALANATRFGLGSAIFTNDDSEIEEAANRLDAGSTFVNTIVASDPRLPFGGVKASGYGRELSAEGIREFVNIKTVSVS